LGLEWFVTDETSLKFEVRAEQTQQGAYADEDVVEAQLSFAF
jgi:hypothetical protein